MMLKRLTFVVSALVGITAFAASCLVTATTAEITFPDLYEASIAELQDGLAKGQFSSVDLVKVSHICMIQLFVTSVVLTEGL